jgi:hypothetical protein
VISHDPHRNLLTWTIPPDAPLSSIDHNDGDRTRESSAVDRDDASFAVKWAAGNGGFVKVWDLSSIVRDNDCSAAARAMRPPPKVPPIAIARLPTSAVAASSSLSSSSSSSSSSSLQFGAMIAGLSHSFAPAASLTCVSLDGSRLLVHSAPLPNAVDDADDGQEGGGGQSLSLSSSPASPVQSKRKKGADGAKPTILHVNFALLRVVPLALSSSSSSVKGTAMSASHLTPDVVMVATERGVFNVYLDDGKAQASSDLPGGSGDREDTEVRIVRTAVPTSPAHAVISLGGVGNRPGILFVEDRIVYMSRFRSTASSNDARSALIQKVDLHDMTIVCTLQGGNPPWRMVRSTRLSTFIDSLRPMKIPPRLIPSPSGRYLCLYWEGEKRYEILHAGSLLAREQVSNLRPATPSDCRGQRVTPYVESGSLVSSFAWIGDDDNFAVLRQLESFPIVSDGNDVGLGGMSNPIPYPSLGKQRRPKVELFKLAEVSIDAVELVAGASIAAATSVSLGSLTVRGGDRYVPNALFGGPSLCVCCVSTSDRADFGDNVAYFYSRKAGAIEQNDERASTYFSVGTPLPYPDLVTWDDHGRLCAISCSFRVAVYLSDKSRFILLGSVRVAESDFSDVEPPLLSMKFVHGVLYCSTQSSVHAVFLGNIEDDDTVCEMDTFTIATTTVLNYGMDDPDISSPVPTIAALTKPHVLAYHSGGLLVSTSCGLRLLSLSHPMIRIGALLAANLIDKARKWIVAMPKVEHDSLAHFLIRRGYANLAISELSGLSLETYIDLCMRYERTDELVYLVSTRGTAIISETCDWGRDCGNSAFLSIGVYMLGKGKIEIAKKMIALAVEVGVRELLVDCQSLATFISVVDQLEGGALLKRVTDSMDFNINRQVALVNVL